MNEIKIKGMALDSRRVKPGDLFIALSGNVEDGRRYIPDAIDKGAAAVLVEPFAAIMAGGIQAQALSKKTNIPIIEFSHLRNSISAMAGRFFSDPSKELSLIAITGTNGKTSCSHFIAQILEAQKHPCAVMGTLGNGFLNALHNSNPITNTTLDPISAQQELAALKEQGAAVVAMEVTSHALTQGRVEGLHFKTAIFTNLTRDHLDYHHDMQSYFAAKKRLFTEFNPSNVIINVDDEYGQTLLNEIMTLKHNNSKSFASMRVFAFYTNLERGKQLQLHYQTRSQGNEIDWIIAKDLTFTDEGLRANIETPWGKGELLCPLFGHFNLSNVLAALAAVCVENVPFVKGLEVIQHLKPVAGRMISLKNNPKGPKVVVDYAHTPDALLQVLQALRLHCRGKLWCVFGCGGDRDRGKRPEMAAIAEAFSDKIIVTQDNPRTENPDIIIQDIMQGFKTPKKIILEPNRKEAIALAINSTEAKDIVLVAGKGHEDYQIIGTEKFPFSDQLEAIEALNRRI